MLAAAATPTRHERADAFAHLEWHSNLRRRQAHAGGCPHCVNHCLHQVSQLLAVQHAVGHILGLLQMHRRRVAFAKMQSNPSAVWRTSSAPSNTSLQYKNTKYTILHTAMQQANCAATITGQGRRGEAGGQGGAGPAGGRCRCTDRAAAIGRMWCQHAPCTQCYIHMPAQHLAPGLPGAAPRCQR